MYTVRTTALLSALTGLLLAVGYCLGGSRGMTIMFVISLLINFSSYWYSDRIVLSMYGAREVTAQDAADLIKLVAALAKKAKMPMPKVYIINTEVPNAFATGRNPSNAAVAVTTGIIRTLRSEELEGVIAHELAHIKNHDTLISTVVASVAGVFTMIGNIAQWMVFPNQDNTEEKNSHSQLATMAEFMFLVIIAPLTATLIQLGISRSREFKADETGALICGNPLALASALEKIEYYAQNKVMSEATPAAAHMFIVNPFCGTGSWLMCLFSTHPTTSERIAKLQLLANSLR